MQIRSVGIDLGKTTFHLVALSAAGKVLLRKKFTQKQLITFIANLQTCLIGMEAFQALTSSDVFCENKAIT
jgi:transposase